MSTTDSGSGGNHMPRLNALPDGPADRFIRPMVRFTRIEVASGGLLVTADPAVAERPGAEEVPLSI